MERQREGRGAEADRAVEVAGRDGDRVDEGAAGLRQWRRRRPVPGEAGARGKRERPHPGPGRMAALAPAVGGGGLQPLDPHPGLPLDRHLAGDGGGRAHGFRQVPDPPPRTMRAHRRSRLAGG
ncbi:MAG: hypothetical protein AB7F97_04540 [Solirubrobacterales bacterium]